MGVGLGQDREAGADRRVGPARREGAAAVSADDDVTAYLREQMGEDGDSLLARAIVSVPWFDYPLPRRWHRCRAVQSGCIGSGALYERCACGGIRRNGGAWLERNSRRAAA